MAKKDGSLILVQIGGVTLTGLTSNTLNLTVDTIVTTTKDSNRHKEYIAGEDGETLDFECLYDPSGSYSLSELRTAAKAKAAIAFVYGGIVAGDHIVSGNGIITTVNWTNGKNEASGISGTIQVTGGTTDSTLSDATAPLFESAWVNNATPTILRVKFNENLDRNYIVAGTAWAADGSVSGAKTVSSSEIPEDKPYMLYLTMQEAYVAGDTITIQYTKPGSGVDIRDKSGNQVASFGPEAVTNNVA